MFKISEISKLHFLPCRRNPGANTPLCDLRGERCAAPGSYHTEWVAIVVNDMGDIERRCSVLLGSEFKKTIRETKSEKQTVIHYD